MQIPRPTWLFSFLLIFVVAVPASAQELFPPCLDQGWDFSSSLLLLKPNGREDESLLFFSTGEMDAYNGSNFNLNYESGIEFELTRHLTEDLRLSGSYFQVFQSGADESGVLAPGTYRFETTPPSTFDLGAASPSTTALQSEFLSAELNLEHDLNDFITVLFGFRYFGFDDKLSFLMRDPGNFNYYRWGTQNDLYGGQIGTEVLLWEEDWFRLDFTGKFAVFNNQVEGSFIAQDDTLSFNNFADESSETTSTMFDLHTEGTFFLTDHWSFIAGYRVIFVDSVAFSTEQITQTSEFDGANERESIDLAMNDELFLHGFNFGFLCTW
ncbi:MAG: hypothetical protein KDA65_03620 [Planctomycetaceae bacterium]|nr:hypothetical protein [Planctomycetaceae bacterium]